MKKSLIAFFGWGLISGLAYGNYPPPKNLLRQLCGKKGLDDTFKQAFWNVREEASDNRFASFLPILGENQGLITAFDKDLDPFGTSVLQRTNSIWGEFSWKLNGTNISKAEQIRAAVEKERSSLSEKGFENLTKVCQTLLSGRFAENLLGEEAVHALYGYCKKEPCSAFSVNFERYTYDEENTGVFWFRILYSQQHQSDHVFMVGFHLWYDVERDCFATSVWDRVKKCYVPYHVEVSCFWINDYEICLHTSGLTDEDLRWALNDSRESGKIDIFPKEEEDPKEEESKEHQDEEGQPAPKKKKKRKIKVKKVLNTGFCVGYFH